MRVATLACTAIFILFFASCASVPKGPVEKTVLLISLDGFRWDYVDKVSTPNLHALMKSGVRAKGLKPVFPSVTFPNHYSIVTGLYSEHQGIVSNDMYDPSNKRRFAIKDSPEVDASDWWEGEPMWVTAQKQGLRSGTMFWVGSTAEIQGVRPTYFEKYDALVSKTDRIKKILSWLDLPQEKRPRFLTLYFEDADSVGHKFGPDSEEEKKAIADLDLSIGELWAELGKRDLQDLIDIIIVSDHGMAMVEANHGISLEKWVKPNQVEMVGGGAFANLWPKPGEENKIYRALSRADSHFKIYRKKEIPERFHYQAHRRIAPLLILADEGWYLEKFGKHFNRGGTHGYDNELPSMQGTLIVRGPSFKEGVEFGPVENIDLYELMCQVLGIKPAKNDGNLNRVSGLLKEPSKK